MVNASMELTRFCAKAETAAQMISFPDFRISCMAIYGKACRCNVSSNINLVFPLPENGYKNTTGQYYDWWYQFRFIFPIKSRMMLPLASRYLAYLLYFGKHLSVVQKHLWNPLFHILHRYRNDSLVNIIFFPFVFKGNIINQGKIYKLFSVIRYL